MVYLLHEWYQAKHAAAGGASSNALIVPSVCMNVYMNVMPRRPLVYRSTMRRRLRPAGMTSAYTDRLQKHANYRLTHTVRQKHRPTFITIAGRVIYSV